MWSYCILGIDIYHILNWFFIYSFLGWVWESSYVSIKRKRLVNRGFVFGPFCTIYGFGAVAVYLLLRPVADNLLLLYLGGVLVPTLLEYITALLMEEIFHTSWWDYSRNKYNFQGRICLGASIGWGFFTVALFKILHPFVERIVGLYSVSVGKILILTVSILYGIDFVLAFASAMQISKRLERMEQAMDELFEYVQSTRLYETTEELKERFELYLRSDYRAEVKARMEKRLDAVIAFSNGLDLEPGILKEQIENRIESLHGRYEALKSQKSFGYRRLENAYPHLKSKTQAVRERARKRLQKDHKNI